MSYMKNELAIIGEFNPDSDTHAATNAAIEHSKKLLAMDLNAYWVPTEQISERLLKQADGLWVAPGSPYRSMEKALFAIEYGRKYRIPALGTCGGFQHMIIEYARNVLGHEAAQHAEYTEYTESGESGEYHPDTNDLFITRLECSLYGREMRIAIAPNSMVASLYGQLQAKEKYYCSFGVNPAVVELIHKGPIRFVGSDSEGELRLFEYPEHRFFVGTLFVPQTNSTAKRPHPVITGLLKAMIT